MEFLKTMKLKGYYPNSGTNQALLYDFHGTNEFLEAKHFMDMVVSEGRRPRFSVIQADH